MKRITIKDIARELKLHHSTVSRALRGEATVNEKTRNTVLEYAKQHGYQINMSALQLRGSIKNMIAVLVPNIHHSFFSNIVSIITNLAYEKGYVVSVFQSNEKYEQEKEIIKTLIRNNVAGVIASVSMETVNSEHFRKLKNYHIPLILFDRVCSDVEVPKVTVNNYEVVAEAVELLIKKGYQRIAHISGPDRINVFSDRQAGYLSSIKRFGLSYSRIEIVDSYFTIEEGEKAVRDLFLEPEKPDALICDSHFLTLGAFMRLREMNLNVPEDVGLAGFGESPYFEVISQEIVTLIQPEDAIANGVFELLMKEIENVDDVLTENIVYSATIIRR